MLDSVLAPVAAWVVGVISAMGYAGVAGLMAIESACIPLPSEVIMPFAGHLASTGRFNLVLAATAGAVGCNIGSTLAYAAGGLTAGAGWWSGGGTISCSVRAAWSGRTGSSSASVAWLC